MVYGERMGWLQLAGMAVAFVGVYVLAGDPTQRPDPFYFLLVVLGAFAWAVANILIKRLGRISPFVLNAWVAVIGAPILFSASAVLEDGQLQAIANAGWRGWGTVLFMAVGASITAYGLWYHLLGKHQLNRIVPLTLLAPVLAVALAVLDPRRADHGAGRRRRCDHDPGRCHDPVPEAGAAAAKLTLP